MNVLTELVAYIENLTGAILGQTLFIGQAPSSNRVADSIWWIIEDGGGVTRKNITGELSKSYNFNIFYRSRDYGEVKTALYQLEEDLNCDSCTQFDSLDTIDIEATAFPIDNDLDNEDRKIGLVQVTILIYKECNNGIS